LKCAYSNKLAAV